MTIDGRWLAPAQKRYLYCPNTAAGKALAESIVNKDGRLVVYSGDDQRFEHLYKCAIDRQGRLSFPQISERHGKKASGTADGVWALEIECEGRGTGKTFFRVPVGAEMCGPRFTPNDKTLFVAVQHPATDATKDFPGFERGSTFEDPATRWRDFNPNVPPRPSVVAITKDDGGVIGS